MAIMTLRTKEAAQWQTMEWCSKHDVRETGLYTRLYRRLIMGIKSLFIACF